MFMKELKVVNGIHFYEFKLFPGLRRKFNDVKFGLRRWFNKYEVLKIPNGTKYIALPTNKLYKYNVRLKIIFHLIKPTFQRLKTKIQRVYLPNIRRQLRAYYLFMGL